MICVETQYFSLNRNFLRLIGLWPRQRTNFVRCQFIFFLGIMTSFIIFQMTTFITVQCTTSLFVNVVCSTLYFVGSVIEYSSFYINAKPLKYFLEQSQYICNGLKDENEIAIIEKYGNHGKRYTSNIILLTVSGILIISLQPILLHIDVFMFINKSRSHGKTWIETEYFVDPDKYYYLILLHTVAAICTAIVTFSATGSMFLAFLKHACGMFSIASVIDGSQRIKRIAATSNYIYSYRLEQMMTINIQGNNSVQKVTMRKRIINAVDIHRKAMECSFFLISKFERSFFLLIAVGVLCLSLDFLRVIQLISLDDNMEELFIRVLCAGLTIIFMFLANYAGQEIMDHNEHVYCTAYNVRWYTAPLHVQKMIFFLLQRGNKFFGLRIGGLFTSSLECFATLTSASMSYFTVMYSTQK